MEGDVRQGNKRTKAPTNTCTNCDITSKDCVTYEERSRRWKKLAKEIVINMPTDRKPKQNKTNVYSMYLYWCFLYFLFVVRVWKNSDVVVKNVNRIVVVERT